MPVIEYDLTRDEEESNFFCPVCGIDLSRGDFDKPERDYYCPSCSTRQTPAIL